MSLDVLHQIAKQTGVSRWTVSRVLRGEVDYVRPHAAKRAIQIREMAESLGYRPNAAAQAIGRGRFDTMALLSNADDSGYVSWGLLSGLQNELAALKQHLVLERVDGAALAEPDAMPRILRSAACDAIMFHAVGALPERYEQIVAQVKLPVVWVNAKRSSDCVYFSDEAAAFEATQHLIRLGHRRIEFLTSTTLSNSHYSVEDRRSGYLDAIASAGLTPHVTEMSIEATLSHQPSPSETLRPMLRRRDRPTAVLASTSQYAGMVYVEALRLHMSVPGDLSIIGFGPDVTNATGARIGVCKLPETSLGREAARLAMRKVIHPERRCRAKVLPIAFHPYDTVSPPKVA
jgi:DNA-binding LacI/PurR family transcriptional regulator